MSAVVTMQKYRDEIKDNAVVGYMRNKNVVQTVLVSPYQIEQYYQQNLRLFQQDEQIKVSTIVLRKSLFPSQKTDADGKQVTYDPQEEITKEILYKLDTGADFRRPGPGRIRKRATRMTAANSAGSRKTARPRFAPTCGTRFPSCNPASIPMSSRPPTAFFYIVQVEDRKKSAMTPLEDVRAQIEQTVINEETQVRQQQWLDSLRAKAFIKMFL